MASKANPARRMLVRLRILLATLCMIAFAAGPTACLAAMPHTTATQAATVEMDCHPCCAHRAPANVLLNCCALPQDAPPARIATAPSVQPALVDVRLESLSSLKPVVPMPASRASATSPPSPRLVALRI